ncbi:hypothetical protein HAX54_018931, partial [Datura stramonium]|nr:hypothetical protein [Datura stramonium]
MLKPGARALNPSSSWVVEPGTNLCWDRIRMRFNHHQEIHYSSPQSLHNSCRRGSLGVFMKVEFQESYFPR